MLPLLLLHGHYRSTSRDYQRNWHLHIRSRTCDVEDNNCCTGVLYIGRDQGVETLLTCSIPKLHTQALVIDVDSFRDEVNSYSWLSGGVGTCSLPVKLSKMNRLMMEVLPTDWSPSITILHLMAVLFYIFKLYKF